MKKIFIIYILLNSYTINSMLNDSVIQENLLCLDNDNITLPDLETLNNRLMRANFGHFIKKNNIIQRLANMQISKSSIIDLVNVFDMAVLNYEEELDADTLFLSSMVQNRRSDFLRLVLMDSADGLTELNRIMNIFNQAKRIKNRE